MDLSDDSDESSSVDTLEKFREEWQQELVTTSVKPHRAKPSSPEVLNSKTDNDANKAELLFIQGIEMEKLGKVFEAMRLYRRAVHIDPDIEFKIYESSLNTQNNNITVQSTIDQADGEANFDANEHEDLSDVDLAVRFQLSIQNGNGILFNRDNAEKGVIVTSGLHISDLPMEIVLYILRWVVSSQLDLRSLEQCSMVSKGFYLCARDEEIWKLACVRVWGHVVALKTSKYASWRQMFIERPRVWFNGCYISKTTYLRYGERNFQDQFYRPVHLIEYYRYVRFFPDGTVLMVTSADEPSQIVGKLQNRNRTDVLKGHFRFTNDIAIVVLKKTHDKTHQYGRVRGYADYEIDATTFCLQLEMSYTKKRRNPQLLWKQYSIVQKRNKYEELSTDFDLTPAKYPPLIFSRVKSYESHALYPI